MAKDPAAPRGHGLDVEFVEAAGVHRAGKTQFEDQLASGGATSKLVEACPRIHQARDGIVWRDEQPDPAASSIAAETVEHDAQRRATDTAALESSVNRQPAKPPAGGVPKFGMNDEEPGESATGLDCNHGVRRAPPHGADDLGDRAEEPFSLAWFELYGSK